MRKSRRLHRPAGDQAVFLRDSPRPAAGDQEVVIVCQSRGAKRCGRMIFHEFKDSYRYFPVCLDPISQVLPELRMEERFAFSGTAAAKSSRNRSTSCVGSWALARPAVRESLFHPEFRQDLRYWVKTDRKVAVRILELVEDVMRDPFAGIGKPEPLKFGVSSLDRHAVFP